VAQPPPQKTRSQSHTPAFAPGFLRQGAARGELDPTQSASVQLAPEDLTHGDRRRETASLQLFTELLNGRLPLAAALDASVAPDDALIVSPLALGLGLFPRRQKTGWLVQETHPGSALGAPSALTQDDRDAPRVVHAEADIGSARVAVTDKEAVRELEDAIT
jgi:hypothetical protein